MKRVITSVGIQAEHNGDDGPCLKRAKSSLFSIATFAEDESNPNETLPALNVGATSLNPPLVDDGDVVEDGPVSMSGLFPLDDSDDDDDDVDAPGDSASSWSSSSDIDEGKDSVDGASAQQVISSQNSPDEPPISGEVVCKKEIAVPDVPESNDQLTGLVFESGSKHFDRHNRFHKERPIRITSVHDYLAKAKQTGQEKTLSERCHLLEHNGNKNTCIKVEPKKSPEELWLDDYDYLRVHLPGYMQRLDQLSKCNCHHRLDIEAAQFKSIYFTSDSVHEAKVAASSLCKLVSRVVSGSLDNGFAVIRPPGHHAEPSLAGGYCVINNVAVAAAYAQAKLGTKRVLIVDWDIHHGNGTQRCFFDNPNVLYFSAHRYHGGNFFPFLRGGGPTSLGSGPGEGFNINVGWNEKRIGDDEYLVLWEKLLMPIAIEFDPDLVLVSAGFDAARGDMGECDVSPECFARLTRRLKTLANGKLVCALEGGYVRSVLCKCVESVLASLLDTESNDKSDDELETFYKNVGDNDMLDCINSSAAKSIQDTMRAHAKYWNCLKTAGGNES